MGMSEVDDKIAPGFLVSVPQMLDPDFQHSVVYLIAHGDEGAFGLTINRPGQLTLPEVCAELGFEPKSDGAVFRGGPVEPHRGFMLHGGAAALSGAETIEPGVHISGMPETLKTACDGGMTFRLFLGYSGWGPGQLEQELSHGAWLSVQSTPHHIFETDPNAVWERVLRDAGIDPGLIVPPANDTVN